MNCRVIVWMLAVGLTWSPDPPTDCSTSSGVHVSPDPPTECSTSSAGWDNSSGCRQEETTE